MAGKKPNKKSGAKTAKPAPPPASSTSVPENPVTASDESAFDAPATIELNAALKTRAREILEWASWLCAGSAPAGPARIRSDQRRSSALFLRTVDRAAAVKLSGRLATLGSRIVDALPADLYGHLARVRTICYRSEDWDPLFVELMNRLSVCHRDQPQDELFLHMLRRKTGGDPLQYPKCGSEWVLAFIEHLLPLPLLMTAEEISNAWVSNYPLPTYFCPMIDAFLDAFNHDLFLSVHPAGVELKERFHDLELAHHSLVAFTKTIRASIQNQQPPTVSEAIVQNAPTQSATQPESNIQDLQYPPVNDAIVENPPTQAAAESEPNPSLESTDPPDAEITILKPNVGPVQISATGGIIAKSLAQKRTLVALARLRKRTGFLPCDFYFEFSGKKNSDYAASRFYELIKSAGLMQYRTTQSPYSFPRVRITVSGLDDEGLKDYLTTARKPD